MSFEVAQRPLCVYVESGAAYVPYPNVSNRTEMVTMDLKQLLLYIDAVRTFPATMVKSY